MTPEHLTNVLRKAGALGELGVVADVVVESSRTTLISSIARLRLTCTGASGPVPSHLFLKTRRGDADAAWDSSGRSEANFYATVGAVTPPGLLPRCYEAVAPPDGAWHLLLEDLSTTHEDVGDWPVPPTAEASDPRLLSRYRSHRDLTIVHGDAHAWNALLSRDRDRPDVRLIDWDGWRVDMATDDLAYMIALYWSSERRRRHERRTLERYHATLVAGGVRAYGLDALWQDYRLSVLGLPGPHPGRGASQRGRARLCPRSSGDDPRRRDGWSCRSRSVCQGSRGLDAAFPGSRPLIARPARG